MKRTIVVVLALFAFVYVKAQNGSIYYTEYQPDTCYTFHYDTDSLVFDLDQDGTGDIVLTSYFQSGVGSIAVINTPSTHWQWSWAYKSQFTPLTDTTSINGGLNWQNSGGTPAMYPEFTHYAFRHLTENGYCYGWAYVYAENVSRICMARMAYCTIPNYPLVWGQTELHENVSESGTVGFAGVVPNPTTGVFTVTGENLNLIEVYDVLGQRITSLTANSDQTTIDLSGQPAGVYLVTVTDREGKLCVKKVVKQ